MQKKEKRILLTTKKSPLGRIIDDVFTKNTTLSATGSTLTLKDLERGFKALKKADKERQKWISEMVSSNSWQKLNKRINKLIHKLSDIAEKKNKHTDWNNLMIAYKCLIAISPDTYHAVHPLTKKELEKLFKKHKI